MERKYDEDNDDLQKETIVEEGPLAIIEMIENLEANMPKNPSKYYLDNLKYYKSKLESYV